MSARQFGDQLLTRLLTYTMDAIPGAIGVGLSIATGGEEAATPHSAAAVGVAPDLDRAQWSHATGPLWEAFRRGSVLIRPELDRTDGTRPANAEARFGSGIEFGVEAGAAQAGAAGPGAAGAGAAGPGGDGGAGDEASVSGRRLLGLERVSGAAASVADAVRGVVFSSGEWGGELPVVLSVYLDRPPTASTLQEIDRHEPVLTQALAVVEYCAGEELVAEQMVQMNQYRRVIEQAKGLVMAAIGADSAEAFETLARASQHFNVRLRSLAVALVEHVGSGEAEHPEDPDLVVHPSATDRKVAVRVWAALSASPYLAGGTRAPGSASPREPSVVTRLRRVSPAGPGYARVRRGRGFEYRADGVPIRDAETLARIRGLAIPPAWRDVWICPDPRGHLQAVGTDAKGRRQYLYHPAWREHRDRAKHARVLTVAAALPAARTVVRGALEQRGLGRERVLACAFRLLDLGFFRVGGEEYLEENGSFGLATLLREHVRVHRDERITFEYVAKSGLPRRVVIADAGARAVVASLARRVAPGDQLFGYQDGRRWRDVTAADVNAYVRELLGDATAKDFRTWHGTVLAAVQLAARHAAARQAGRTPMSERARKRAVAAAMREVSGYLGNTPAVARASYVDPRVVDRFHDGRTIEPVVRRLRDLEPPYDARAQARIERAVIRLLG